MVTQFHPLRSHIFKRIRIFAKSVFYPRLFRPSVPLLVLPNLSEQLSVTNFREVWIWTLPVEISTDSVTLVMLSSYREGLSRWSYFVYLNQDPIFYSQNMCHLWRWQSLGHYFYVQVLQDGITWTDFILKFPLPFTKIQVWGETQSFIPPCPKWMTNLLN
jgi:hypothetical protein